MKFHRLKFEGININYNRSLSRIHKLIFTFSKLSKEEVKISNQYNQVPHLTCNTIWDSDKNKILHNTLVREPRGQHFPAGTHKATRNRPGSITKTNINEP